MSQYHQAGAREGRHLMDEMPAVRETLSTLQTQLRDFDARARQLIQERPLTALAAAVAVGFALRRILSLGRR